jgi:hypothetical protein
MGEQGNRSSYDLPTAVPFAVIVVVTVLFLPFLGKPVHMDDNGFLSMAKAFDQASIDFSVLNSSHPPLLALYLAFLKKMSPDGVEIVLHGGYLLFPLLFALSTARLAHRLALPAIPIVLLLIGNIAVLPVGQTLMADLPMAAFWLLAAERLASWKSSGNPNAARIAIFTLFVASLISYQTLLVIPAYILYARSEKRGLNYMLGAGLLSASAILFFLIVSLFQGVLPVSNILGEVWTWMTVDRMLNKAFSIPVNIGVATIVMLPIVGKELLRAKIAIIAAAVMVLAAVSFPSNLSYTLLEKGLLMLLAAWGVAFVVYGVEQILQIKDAPIRRALLVMIGIVLFYNLFVMTFGALRYLMPLIAILLMVAAAKVKRPWLLVLASVLSVVLGCIVAFADYEYAQTYKGMAEKAGAQIGTRPDRVWYVGPWGMAYYMGRQGFRQISPSSNEPTQGDLILVPEVAKLWDLSPQLVSRVQVIDEVMIQSRFPVRVMSARVHAGYYSSAWGYFPFVFSRDRLERFLILRVIRPA